MEKLKKKGNIYPLIGCSINLILGLLFLIIQFCYNRLFEDTTICGVVCFGHILGIGFCLLGMMMIEKIQQLFLLLLAITGITIGILITFFLVITQL